VAGDVDAGGLVVPAVCDADTQGQAGGQVEEGGGAAGAGQGGRGCPARAMSQSAVAGSWTA